MVASMEEEIWRRELREPREEQFVQNKHRAKEQEAILTISWMKISETEELLHVGCK